MTIENGSPVGGALPAVVQRGGECTCAGEGTSVLCNSPLSGGRAISGTIAREESTERHPRPQCGFQMWSHRRLCPLQSPMPLLLLAIAMLKDKAPGSFIVRDSHSFRGAYGLAMKVATPPPSVLHLNKKGNGSRAGLSVVYGG